MNETRHISDIFRTAMQLEVDGRQYYEEIATKVVNPLGKAMFNQLARDELEHLETLKRRYQRSFPGREIPRVTPMREGLGNYQHFQTNRNKGESLRVGSSKSGNRERGKIKRIL